jgi:DNA-binding LacI/PurR family transcriptional regulator
MNIGEVARRCGVSRSTVSYALSGKRAISEATRQRILDVVAEVGYRRPSPIPAGRERRGRAVGLVIPPAGEQLTPMQLDFVGAVMNAAAHADLDVLLSPSLGDRSFDRIMTGPRLDGLILTEIRLSDPRVERLRTSHIPFVTIGRAADQRSTTWVDLDTATLVGQCVDHLAELGHRHLALVNRSAELVISGYAPAHRARASFARAVDRHHAEGFEFCCGDRPEAGESCVEHILNAYPQVTGLVTINEAALPGIQRALERADVEVPRRFSVTGLVARHWAEQFHPRLTAIDVPAADLGAAAVRFLVERIAQPRGMPAQDLLAPPLAVRESTGPVPPRTGRRRVLV